MRNDPAEVYIIKLKNYFIKYKNGEDLSALSPSEFIAYRIVDQTEKSSKLNLSPENITVTNDIVFAGFDFYYKFDLLTDPKYWKRKLTEFNQQLVTATAETLETLAIENTLLSFSEVIQIVDEYFYIKESVKELDYSFYKYEYAIIKSIFVKYALENLHQTIQSKKSFLMKARKESYNLNINLKNINLFLANIKDIVKKDKIFFSTKFIDVILTNGYEAFFSKFKTLPPVFDFIANKFLSNLKDYENTFGITKKGEIVIFKEINYLAFCYKLLDENTNYYNIPYKHLKADASFEYPAVGEINGYPADNLPIGDFLEVSENLTLNIPRSDGYSTQAYGYSRDFFNTENLTPINVNAAPYYFVDNSSFCIKGLNLNKSVPSFISGEGLEEKAICEEWIAIEDIDFFYKLDVNDLNAAPDNELKSALKGYITYSKAGEK